MIIYLRFSRCSQYGTSVIDYVDMKWILMHMLVKENYAFV